MNNRKWNVQSSNLTLALLVVIGGRLISLQAQDAPSGSAPRGARYSRTTVNIGKSYLAASPVAPRAGGLTIVPTFDESITKDRHGAEIMATINASLAGYQAKFSDPITITITFKKVNDGLGASSTSVTNVSYADFLTALKAHAVSVDDAIALAHLPVQANNPVNNDPNMTLTLPNARVLGFAATANPGETDSTVSLNIDLMNITAADTDAKKYSLRETAEHEINEVFGTPSALGQGTTGPVSPSDLFRYDGKGARSYTQDPMALSYFSIDGTTTLAQYNQDKSGDFSDWYSINGGQTPQIQDAFGTPGGKEAVLGTELIVLDVIGYTRVSTIVGGGPALPPVITSPASCDPNPAFIGGICTFTVAATDPNNSPITVAWDFGDGTKGADITATHAFALPGVYTVTALVLDGLGASTKSTVVVTVSRQIITSVNRRQSFLLNFKTPTDAATGKDMIDVTMSNDAFTTMADDTVVKFIIGTATIDEGTLSKGKASGDFGGKFTVNARAKTIRYVTSRAFLQNALATYGAANATTSDSLTIPIYLSFMDNLYGDMFSFKYVGTAGKTGRGR